MRSAGAVVIGLILVLIFSLTSESLISDHSMKEVFAEGEDDEEERELPDDDTSEEFTTADETGFPDYTGDVDIVTGNPVNKDKQRLVDGSKIAMPDGSFYDTKTGLYLYDIYGGTIGCSVCDGMIVGTSVNFATSGEFTAAVYCNGQKLKGIPGTVSTPGTYIVISWDNSSQEQVLSFQIVEKITGRITKYILPKGFALRSATLEGQSIKSGYGTVDFSKEGYYEVAYRCINADLDYYLNVTIDHTPPNVIFNGLDENNTARGPVTLMGLAEGDKVFVTFNGEEGWLNSKNQVTSSGKYHITVTDNAGNTVSRDFTILMYLNVKGVVFFSLIIVLIIGVIVALYISRKRLRVR